MVGGRDADKETRRRANTAAAGEERARHDTATRDYPHLSRRPPARSRHVPLLWGHPRTQDMTRYPAPLGGKACHVLCGACGHLFRLIFDGRRHLRIPASLPGRLFPSAPQDESDELSQKLGYTTITVTSLSSGGI